MKAFPYERKNGYYSNGMDLRDYFAARAMQSFLTHTVVMENLDEEVSKTVTESAYKIADAMIAVKKKTEVK